MYDSRFKPVAVAVLALAAVLALGACGKKVDNATSTSPATPTPMTSPSTTDSGAAGTPMGSPSGAMGSGTMGSGMTAPATGASAPASEPAK